jgi:tetratricopeptide (TPR) repeat protein
MNTKWHAGPLAVNATFGDRAPAPAFPPASRLSKAKDFFSTVQASMLAGVAVLGFCALCLFLFDAVAQEKIVVDAISTPPEMIARGLTKEIAAQRLIDSIQHINATAGTEKAKYEAASISSSVEGLNVPDAAASVKQFLLLLRKYAGISDARITGEFICTNEKCGRDAMTLRLRISGKVSTSLDVDPTGTRNETEYMEKAAERIIKEVDPYVYASYLIGRDKKDDAYKISRSMYILNHKDAKWGYLMMGNHYSDDKANKTEAVKYYMRAISADRRFSQAYNNIGNVYLESAYEKEDGPDREADLGYAERVYLKAIRIEPCDASSHDGIALIHMERRNYAMAEKAARQAVKCDQNEGAYLATLARIRMRMADDAAQIDAAQILNDAIVIDPDDSEVSFAMGELQELRGDYAAAAKYFKAALGSQPSDGYRRGYARTLYRKGDHHAAVGAYGQIRILLSADRTDIAALAEELHKRGDPLAAKAETLLRRAASSG